MDVEKEKVGGLQSIRPSFSASLISEPMSLVVRLKGARVAKKHAPTAQFDVLDRNSHSHPK